MSRLTFKSLLRKQLAGRKQNYFKSLEGIKTHTQKSEQFVFYLLLFVFYPFFFSFIFFHIHVLIVVAESVYNCFCSKFLHAGVESEMEAKVFVSHS